MMVMYTLEITCKIEVSLDMDLLHGLPDGKVEAAVFNLVSRYPIRSCRVEIYNGKPFGMGEKDIVAHYFEINGKTGNEQHFMTIGAHWLPEKEQYSYHS